MAFEPIDSLVARIVERHPDRAAVDCPHGLLTYAELGARADDVAVSMQRAGVRPGSPVVLLTDDRRELVPGILGILRAGGVCVPLDPVTDPAVLRRMVTGLGHRAAVVGSGQHRLAAEVLGRPAPSAVERICVPETAGASGRGGPYVRRASPADPCCAFPVLRGRGRRGTVVRTLGAVDHDIRRVLGQVRADTGCRVSQLGPVASDAMLRDVFVPLVVGGTICVPPEPTRHDGAALRRWLRDEAIAVVHTRPETVRLLLHAVEGTRPEFPALRQVVLDGEELSVADARRWPAVFGPRVPLVHFHGSAVASAPCGAGQLPAVGVPAGEVA